MRNTSMRPLLSYLLVALLLMFAITSMQAKNAGQDTLVYSDVRQLIEQQKVRSLTVEEDAVHLTLWEAQADGTETVSYSIYSFPLFYDDLNDLIVKEWQLGRIEAYDYPEYSQPSLWETLLPDLLMMALIFAMFYFMMNRQNGGGGQNNMSRFGQAKTRTLEASDKKVTFADVAGADEEKESLKEIVDFLKDPQRFTALGARIPKGTLLVGPPGTGKTLLAKATAGEAGVQFLSISGSDFVELYVGVGASRVRDLFEQAKKDAPAIVFIDEIDAVGRQRGAGLGGGHDEREQTLNQLLVEMDGFSSNEGVIVLAATNRVDILDPALLRPGRFDRQIYVGLPDIKGREEVLKVHARGKPLAEDADLREVAKATGGFSGADLENVMNEAALLAAAKRAPFITGPDLHEAVIKVIAGPEKRSRVVTPHARKLTAYHEAGHAVVLHKLPTQDPVHQITIIPRGPAGGMTISLPQEDKSYRSKTELLETITGLLGGRVAEDLFLGDISTGASNDLQRATAIARSMIMKYGMSEKLGSVVFDSGHDEVFIGRSMAQAKSYSEEVATQIDAEIKRILDDSYAQCVSILEANRAEMETVAQYLLEHETMHAAEFEKVFAKEGSPAIEAPSEEK